MAHEPAGHGLETSLPRYTCAHRIDASYRRFMLNSQGFGQTQGTYAP
jgi:hypothetical protein